MAMRFQDGIASLIDGPHSLRKRFEGPPVPLMAVLSIATAVILSRIGIDTKLSCFLKQMGITAEGFKNLSWAALVLSILALGSTLATSPLDKEIVSNRKGLQVTRADFFSIEKMRSWQAYFVILIILYQVQQHHASAFAVLIFFYVWTTQQMRNFYQQASPERLSTMIHRVQRKTRTRKVPKKLRKKIQRYLDNSPTDPIPHITSAGSTGATM